MPIYAILKVVIKFIEKGVESGSKGTGNVLLESLLTSTNKEQNEGEY